MPKLDFIQQSGALGYALLFGPGIVLLLIALAVKGAVKTTHNFVISGRLLGFGFGVASLISVWTWSMAVMLSSAQAYTWGTSGLVWFIVPNGLAVIIMVPFGLKVRQKMPAGYTLAEFIRARFQTGISSVATLIFLIGALLGVIMINLAGLVLIMNTIFGLTPFSIVVTGIIVVTVYSYFGGLTTSAVTGTLNTLLLGVGSSVVVLYALAKAGGAQLVFNEVDKLGDQHLNPSIRSPQRVSVSRWRSDCSPMSLPTSRSGSGCGRSGRRIWAAASSGQACGSTPSRWRSACSASSVSPPGSPLTTWARLAQERSARMSSPASVCR